MNDTLMIDVEEELKKVENSIRDVISLVMEKKFGNGWIEKLQISPDRIKKWKERLETETKRLNGTPLETRLLYYADFYCFGPA